MTTRHTTIGRGSAHAKAILIGEHAVVHGRPAVALPLRRLRIDAEAVLDGGSAPAHLRADGYDGALDAAPDRLAPLVTAVRATLSHLGRDGASVHVRVVSSIPLERGLGSSAAAANAIVDAICDLYGADPTADELFELVQTAERVAHGTPSGLDARATRSRVPIVFQNGDAQPLEAASGTTFVIADTGVHGSTKKAVGDVRALLAADESAARALLDRIESLTRQAATDLTNGDTVSLGARMTAAQTALDALGVGHGALTRLIEAAIAAGALGAKLTGGGQGGCMIALAPTPESGPVIASALVDAGAVRSWVVRTGEEE